MSKPRHIASPGFVLIQVLSFVILLSNQIRGYILQQNSSFDAVNINADYLNDYLVWSLAGAVFMLVGLIIHILHYILSTKKLAVHLGSVLIIAGIIAITVGWAYYKKFDNKYVNEQLQELKLGFYFESATTLWIVILTGGLLVLYQQIPSLKIQLITSKFIIAFFVYIQILALVIFYVREEKYSNSENVSSSNYFQTYLDWSRAGTIIMLVGLIVNLIHLGLMMNSKKAIIQIGTALVLVGMIVVTVGAFYLIKYNNQDILTVLWPICLAGGILVIYENFEHIK